MMPAAASERISWKKISTCSTLRAVVELLNIRSMACLCAAGELVVESPNTASSYRYRIGNPHK